MRQYGKCWCIQALHTSSLSCPLHNHRCTDFHRQFPLGQSWYRCTEKHTANLRSHTLLRCKSSHTWKCRNDKVKGFGNSILPNEWHYCAIHLPLRCVIPEIVVGSLKEHPVEAVKGISETANISQIGRVVSRVLMDIHNPTSSTGECRVPGASNVAFVPWGLYCWMFIGADTPHPILKTCIGKPRWIAWSYASEIEIVFPTTCIITFLSNFIGRIGYTKSVL